MEWAKLALEYIKALVWPVAAVVLLVVFRRQLKEAVSQLWPRVKEIELPGGAKISLEAVAQKAVEVEQTAEEISKNRVAASGLLFLRLSLISAHRCEAMWSRQDYARKVEVDAEFRRCLEDAVEDGRAALEYFKREEAATPEELATAKNNLAYYLATRKSSIDKGYAHQLIREVLEAYPTEPDSLETYTWVLLRFADIGSPEEQARDSAEGTRVIRRLVVDEAIPADWRAEMKTKYERLFGTEFAANGI